MIRTPDELRNHRRLLQRNRRNERRRLNVDNNRVNHGCESVIHANNVIVSDNHANEYGVDVNVMNEPIIIDRRHVVENPHEHWLGNMNVSCSHCGAIHFALESVSTGGRNVKTFNDCCNHGHIILDDNFEFPPQLKSLLLNTHQKSASFFSHIRRYNNMMAFASFNANLYQFPPSRNAPYCFKIQGQPYYQINTALLPQVDEQPTYGQLYFIDRNESIEYRCNFDSTVDPILTSILDDEMREFNLFAQSYQMMKNELENFRPVNYHDELQLLFTLKPGHDRRRFNFQSFNEVAAVFNTSADGDIPESYVTCRHSSDMRLQIVSHMDPCAEPWLYPLLYPIGNLGWHQNMRKTNGRRLTRACYVKYKIAIRPNVFNPFLLGRRLFQQWIVDSYVKIEKDRIQYIKSNQKKIHVESYAGIRDYIVSTLNVDYNEIGKYVILPATFVGSPRYMAQSYQDAMAIVRKFGKPDLFLTMTCNPNWKEIQDNLENHQSPADRPDLVARVFHLKKKGLIDLILKRKIFGEIDAYVYVIEFQKRGLPHMHLLLTLSTCSKLSTVEKVDQFICAEIPDSVIDPILHNIVVRNMIHGPCGDWCQQSGRCSKHFPKSFQNETTLNEDGYPTYKRANTGVKYKSRDFEFDNRYVVPYCMILLKLFNCHINVEAVSTIQAVKYLFKYIYKGHDSIAMNIESPDGVLYDESRNYVEGRYVSPIEASYRILSKKLQDKSHTIDRLPLHLPGQHLVSIPDDDVNVDDDVINNLNLDSSTSKLLEYFELNARDLDARQFLYTDIPSNYVYKKVENSYKWVAQLRKRQVFGRMYSISPTNLELFHLRVLLLNVKGATSFDDLKTVDGELHESFAQACLARGLIHNDFEWERAMNEGKNWMMPHRLRCLFVSILIHCNPLAPHHLWEKYKDAMSEDFRRIYSDEEGYARAYECVSNVLEKDGSNLMNFPSMNQTVQHFEHNPDFDNPDNTVLMNEYNNKYRDLNVDQKAVVDNVRRLIENVDVNFDEKCVYLNGAGGTGKTFVYKTICKYMQLRNKLFRSTAFTGIAAILLPNGSTVHKTFAFLVPLLADSTSNIKHQSKEADDLRKTDVIIVDEAPMLPKYALEIMDRTLRQIMNCELPFGGKIILLGGDFKQLLPVLKRANRNEVIDLSIKRSYLWNLFSKNLFNLSINMRALQSEKEFADYLIAVGDGSLNNCNDEIDIHPNLNVSVDSNIASQIFQNVISQRNYDTMAKTAILSCRNEDVNLLNKQVVTLLDVQTEKIYFAMDSLDNCDNGELNNVLQIEHLNNLNPMSIPPFELRLRKHSIVMLTRNISLSNGLCNGTRLEVLELANNLLKCRILSGDNRNKITFIHRISLYSENDYSFTFQRRQFPIRLAFAMTINKSQGQTFDAIGIDLRRNVFSHGQLYVAMSRVRSWQSLTIFLNNRDQSAIKNVAYKEILM